VRRRHDHDRANDVGRVELPYAIGKKSPSAATDWKWQFVFPASRICRDPRFGPPSRYHLHESVVQTGPGLSEGRFQRTEIANARRTARDFEDRSVKGDDLPERQVAH
jgi:hypothetical protein